MLSMYAVKDRVHKILSADGDTIPSKPSISAPSSVAKSLEQTAFFSDLSRAHNW